jgi:plastocyanin
MRSVFGLGAGLLVAGTLVVACGGGGGGGGGGGNNPAVTIAMAGQSGNGQTDTIGAPLPAPLRVLVMEDGAPKQGATVNWSVQSGGGQLSAPTSQTDVDGIATINWTLGNSAGGQSVRATLSGAGGSPVTFNANATAGNPAQIVKQGGDNQLTVLSTGFGTPLTAKVSDRVGNAIQGATVDWAVAGGPVDLNASSSTTNVQGVASVTATAQATGGTGSVNATTTGVAGTAAFTNLTVVDANRLVNVGAGVVFRSFRNNSQNPAVDTVQAGQAVAWLSLGGVHTVESTGSPAFTSSGNLSTTTPYIITFNAAGTYTYDCQVHGNAMTGRVVVQ